VPLTPTPHWLIPRPALADGANIETAVNPALNRIEALFDMAMGGIIKIGMSIMWDGATDPLVDVTGVTFLIRDGRLISLTTFDQYFALIGHGANGGVNPGGGNFRIPDLRGRVSVMMDSSPAMGAASRIPNSNRARFQAGGEERHGLTGAENGPHFHDLRQQTGIGGGIAIDVTGQAGRVAQGGADPITAGPGATENAGSGTPHNIMQPYAVDNWVVRVK
jgi:microcystin-dependent protein